MLEGQLEVVDDGEKLGQDTGPFVGPGGLDFSGQPLAQVVEVGEGSPPAVLELADLSLQLARIDLSIGPT
jgi:hypothetical protein